MQFPLFPLTTTILSAFLPATFASILRQCSGSHGIGGFAGNTFFINVDQIDPAGTSTACSRCESAIEEIAHGLGIMAGDMSCDTSGDGVMHAAVRLEGRAWTQQVVAIQEGLRGCVGPLGVTKGCPCFGGC